MKEKEYKHILFWMPNWLGDVILTLPAIQSVRLKYPDARITAVARPPSNEILTLHPAFDSVIKIPFKKSDGIFSQISFARGLRKYQFDLAIVFPNSFRSALLSCFTDAQIRIGYDTDNRSLFLTDSLEIQNQIKEGHGIDYYYELVAGLGIEKPEKKFMPLKFPKEDRGAEETMSNLGIKAGDLVISMAPGASKPEKRWHTDRFGILCQKIIKERGAKILLFGSLDESDLLKEISQYGSDKTIFPLAGLKLNLVADLIAMSDLFVGNDSGLMHLASLMNTPLIGIFGPGNRLTTEPCIDNAKKEIVSKNYPCSPCRHNFFKECKPSIHDKPFCLEDIGVSDVSDAVSRLLP
ncbi:MAG: lipopolysaccharide heptosyltransferase II [Nitrospinales bacterium]